MIGSNFRMTELQVAIGIAQLENTIHSKRQEIAEFLNEVVKEFDGIKAPITRNKCTHVYCWGAKIDHNKIKISREHFQSITMKDFMELVILNLYICYLYFKNRMGKKGFV